MSSPERSATPDVTPHSTPAKDPPTMTFSSSTPPATPPRRCFSMPEEAFGISFGDDDDAADTRRTRSARFSMASRSDLAVRRRGFMRPQGTEFSTSARSRESVMALGSIAHLQYFFAKTGLLDGKGGGLETKKQRESLRVDTLSVDGGGSSRDSTYSSLRSSPELLLPHEHEFYTESPADDDMDEFLFDESIMLPPTTSTYNPQTVNLPPAPTADMLRSRLRNSLGIVRKTWEEGHDETLAAGDDETPEGYRELQGTELIELATSAIRVAKTYYYSTDITLLSSKDDRTIREEFLAILDVLKRMAQRKFAGGVRTEERDALIRWVDSVERALAEEEKAIADIRSRGRDWLEGDWGGREYDRYHRFLTYFDSSSDPLPAHTPAADSTELPTPFLAALQTGLRLILIHNAVVRRSKRPFGQIPSYHTEFSKPYRMTENLRYWKKAAEIRWEIRLTFDVAGVVNGTDPEAWKGFEADIGRWCDKVLREVRADWKLGEGAAAVGQVRSGRSPTMASTYTMASTNVEVGDSPRRR